MRIANKFSCLALGLMVTGWSPPLLAQGAGVPRAQTAHHDDILSSVSRADRKLYIRLAEAELAGIAAAIQVLAKSNDAQIKSFAQQMIDDYSIALGELSALARDKQVELPSLPDERHRKQAARMAKMSAIDFNSQYAQAAVIEQRAAQKLLEQIVADSTDRDLQALAQKMQPRAQAQLKAALALRTASSP